MTKGSLRGSLFVEDVINYCPGPFRMNTRAFRVEGLVRGLM